MKNLPLKNLCLLSVLLLASRAAATTENVQFFSNALGETRWLQIYTPNGYDPNGTRLYPVIYFLHGGAANHTTYTDFPGRLNFLINNGFIEPTIGVMPDGSGCGPWGGIYTGCNWVNSVTGGNYEDYVVQDVVTYMEANYKVLADRSARAIMGHSMGGFGSMHIALKYPEMFAGVASMAGYLNFQDFIDVHVPAILAEHPEGPPYTWSPDTGDFLTTVWFLFGSGFSPNPANPPYFQDFPLDSNGDVIPSVMDRWLTFDPAGFASNLTPEEAPAIYVDSASGDAFLFHPFNVNFVALLNQLGIPNTFEIFNTTHSGALQQRIRTAVEFLGVLMGGPVGIDESSDVRSAVALRVYPNPVRSTTTFSFSLGRSEQATLRLYDVAGKRVDTLLDGHLAEGAHAVRWDARDVPSGVYYFQLASGSRAESRKLVVAK
jgi:S-formylglutathione hydrolase FrmB